MCLFTIYFQKIDALRCFVECMICFDEFEEASSFQVMALDPKTSLTTEKLKSGCSESFRHVDTLGSQNPRYFGGVNFIA